MQYDPDGISDAIKLNDPNYEIEVSWNMCGSVAMFSVNYE